MEFPLPEDNIGGDDSATNATTASGSKRSFGDLQDDEDDTVVSKKDCRKVDEAEPVVTAAMILLLRESLQSCKDRFASFNDEIASCKDKLASCKDEIASCKDELASCQNELEAAKTEVGEWKSAFQKESSLPARKTNEPRFLIDYIQNLKSSEKSIKEQLEIAQMKLAIRDLKSQLEPEVDSETAAVKIEALLSLLRAANAQVAQLKDVHDVKLAELEKNVAIIFQNIPGLVRPPRTSENNVAE